MNRSLLHYILQIVLLLSTTTASAQIIFNYPGPDTIWVGNDCTAPLDWGHPSNPFISCTTPGCTIDTLDFTISGGYNIGDPVPAATDVTVDYYIVDNFGNSLDTFFSVYFKDTIAPVFDSAFVPPHAFYECIWDVPLPQDAADFVVTDNCPPPGGTGSGVVVVYEGEALLPDTCQGEFFNRVWSATDAAGNEAFYTQFIFLGYDTTAPYFTVFPESDTVTCGNSKYKTWLANQRATIMAMDDGCGMKRVYDDAPSNFVTACGSIVVNFIAEDLCGTKDTAQASYTIIDTVAPVILPPDSTDITITCIQNPISPPGLINIWANLNLEVTDNCTSTSWTNDFTGLSGGCDNNTGTASVQYFASDLCGNSDTITINFTSIDVSPPLVTQQPSDTTVQCLAGAYLPVFTAWFKNAGGALFEDSCTPFEDLSISYRVAGNFVDSAGLVAAMETFLDTTCSGGLEVEFIAADNCENRTSVFATFTVIDTVAPVWVQDPQDHVIQCQKAYSTDSLIGLWLAGFGGGVAVDSCGAAVITNDYAGLTTLGCAGTGAATVTFVAADACGNTTSRTATISVVDTVPPVVAQAPVDTAVECTGADQVALQSWIDRQGGALTTDNCNGAFWKNFSYVTSDSLKGNNIDFGDYPAYPKVNNDSCGWVVRVSFVAEDSCGNQTIASANFGVGDFTAPTITGIPFTIVQNCSDPVILADPLIMDNCDTTVTIQYTIDSTRSADPNDCSYYTYTITRSWTAEDNCGNSATATQTITVQDLSNPTFAIPPDITANCEDAGDLLVLGEPLNVQDNCDPDPDVTFTDSILPGSCPSNYTIQRTWRVEDVCGNSLEGLQTVQIIDTSGPVFSGVPADVTVDCDNIPAPPGIGTDLTAADNCDNALDISFNEISTQGADPDNCDFYNYTITRTWSATDSCGNNTTESQIITVQDTSRPTFVVPAGLTANCQDAGDLLVLGEPTSVVDNCDADPAITFNDLIIPGSCPYNYSIQRTWRAEDACGNFFEDLQTVQIIDTTAPVFSGVPADVTVDCDNIPAPPGIGTELTAADNCDNALDISFNEISTQDADPDNCDFYNYTITRTWSVTDSCGNNATENQTITVQDTSQPTFVVPAGLTANCQDAGDLLVLGEPTSVVDNCDADPAITFNDLIIPGSCPYNYSIQRTWRVEDACGNFFEDLQTVQIIDTTAPVFSGVPADVTVDCDNIPAPPGIGTELTASDNCDALLDIIFNEVSTQGANPGECDFYNYTLTRTWSATDSCGNNTTENQTITVQDTSRPTFIVPAGLTANCQDAGDLLVLGEPTSVVDNCDADPAITFNDLIISGPCPYNYTIQRTWRVEDACGNFFEDLQTVQIIDTAAPVFSGVPADVTVDCDNIPAPPVIGTELTASDNCDASLNIIFNENSSQGTDPGNCDFYNYSITRTWAVTDSCGNFTIESQTITVQDTTRPTFVIPTGLTASCEDADDLLVLGEPTNVQDNCDADPEVTFTDAILPGSCPSEYTIQRTWRVEDVCGNFSEGMQTVEIIDTIAPLFDGMPNDVTVNCDSIPAPPPVGTVITAFDNCDDSLAISFSELSTQGADPENCNFYNYTITRTWSVTDSCGNNTTVSQLITVQDTARPTFILPGDITANCEDAGDLLVLGEPANVLDNCDADPEITFSDETVPGVCLNNYSIQRTWRVEDACGNFSEGVQTVQIIDTAAPVFSGIPADVTVNCDNVPDPPIVGTEVTAADNCDAQLNIIFNEVSDQGSDIDSCDTYSYTIIRTWLVSDTCANSTVRQQIITVQDTARPSFTVPADLTVNCEDVPNLNILGRPANVADNCDPEPEVTFVDVITAGICTNNFTIERRWQVKDACNNFTTGIQMVQVIDTTAPELLKAAEDVVISCSSDAEADSAFIDWIEDHGGASVLNECGMLFFEAWVPGTYDINDPLNSPGVEAGAFDPPSCPSDSAGIHRQETVDFVAFDECGNVIRTSATFTVVDNVPPFFENPPGNMILSTDSGRCDRAVILPVPAVLENCVVEDVLIGQEQTLPITSPVPGDDETPVDPLTINFGPFPAAPVVAVDSATLIITLNNVDGEETSEFFSMFGEDGFALGKTLPTDSQCGNSTTVVRIPGNLINEWVKDGFITIRLEPNIPANQSGRFAINDICPAGPPTGGGGSVTGDFSYLAQQPSGLRFEYALNAGPRILVDPIEPVDLVLPKGTTGIEYFVTDCAGNSADWSFEVTVVDTEPPQIACPGDIVLPILPGEPCDIGEEIALPRPVSITDNCLFSTFYAQQQPLTTAEAYLTFSYDPNYLEYIADDKQYTFTNVNANAAGAFVTLEVTIEGDVENNGEYFTIRGEDGTILGTTETGQPFVSLTPGRCDTIVVPSLLVATFNIPASQYNDWAADGAVTITAESNTNFLLPPPGVAGDGINPYCIGFPFGTPDGQTDSLSTLKIQLFHDQARATYFATGATPIAPAFFPDTLPVFTFDFGETEVFYRITDAVGNADTCSFIVAVVDDNPPEALCKPTTIKVNPSGIDNYILDPSEIDNGSNDNCGIVEYILSQDTFDCSLAGTTQAVSLTVKDAQGNESTCNTLVRVESESPLPTSNLGLCENDTLRLFANPPASSLPNNTLWEYDWSGPKSFNSGQENPVLIDVDPSNSGFYTVVISGLTGCTAEGSVQVVINSQPQTPVITVDRDQVCVDDGITISSPPFSGNTITYYWFLEQPGPDSLVAATINPTLNLTMADTGVFTYYMQVEIEGCISNPSSAVEITVTKPLVATTTNDPVLVLCEGETIILGTPISGPGITYQWSGPAGFGSTAQFPNPIEDITQFNAGFYELIVYKNGCPSAPVQTAVIVNERPPKPEIAYSGPACAGSSVTLFTNNMNGDLYQWIRPTLDTVTSVTDSLVVNNVGTSSDGNWRVRVLQNGCFSETSDPVDVTVEALPQATADNNGPVCSNKTLQLTANTVANATYKWTGPAGFESSVQNPEVNNPKDGIYMVTIKTSPLGCTNTAETLVEVLPAPAITAVSNDGQGCVDGSTDIRLVSTLFPPDDGTYTYSWTGPNGFLSSDSVAIIPDATSQNNGPYSLIVTSGNGCTSLQRTTTVDVRDIPETPLITPTGPIEVCEGDVLTLALNNTYNGTIEYLWTTPAGSFTTTEPSLTIDPAGAIHNGIYSVVVTRNGCQSAVSNLTTVIVNPKPDMPLAELEDAKVCEGDTIKLFTTFIPNAQYNWVGPGTVPPVHNPILFPATTANEGSYQVQVTIKGCASEFSQEVDVDIIEKPEAPLVSNNGPLCIDAPGTELILSITGNGFPADTEFTWYDNNTGQVVGGPTTSEDFIIDDFSNFPAGAYTFVATATNTNGCVSDASLTTTVVLDEIPDIEAFAGDSINICRGEPVTLAGNDPATGTGKWTQTDGLQVTILSPEDATTGLSGLQANQRYRFAWTLSNGACRNYSSDTVAVEVFDNRAEANAGQKIDLCATDTARLNAVPADGKNTGRWSQLPEQKASGVVIVDPSDPATLVSGLEPGMIYSFTWTLENPGCGPFSSDLVLVEIFDDDPRVANAGPDQKICGVPQVELSALFVADVTGIWTSTDPDIDILSPEEPETFAVGLRPGLNYFAWTLSNSACGDFASDTVVIEYEPPIEASNDYYETDFATLIEFYVLENDSIFSDIVNLTLITTPAHGLLEETDKGFFEYTPDVNFTGIDEFIYRICSNSCPDLCDEGLVEINVGKEAPCLVPTIITPNNDGINDALIVPCLTSDRFPNNSLSIFNQWGDEVYRASPYLNDWRGTYNGQDLPAGTYFFVVEFGQGKDPQAGFIRVER